MATSLEEATTMANTAPLLCSNPEKSEKICEESIEGKVK